MPEFSLTWIPFSPKEPMSPCARMVTNILIAVDGGDTQRLAYGGVGSYRYRIVFQGPGGHSWSAFGSANPHPVLGHAWASRR
ncbi:MAG: hypothetical protein SH820_10805 [Xanthomonadales bacterium]|nr:hypothetical protein [Xanthomonadales bacterium]